MLMAALVHLSKPANAWRVMGRMRTTWLSGLNQSKTFWHLLYEWTIQWLTMIKWTVINRCWALGLEKKGALRSFAKQFITFSAVCSAKVNMYKRQTGTEIKTRWDSFLSVWCEREQSAPRHDITTYPALLAKSKCFQINELKRCCASRRRYFTTVYSLHFISSRVAGQRKIITSAFDNK